MLESINWRTNRRKARVRRTCTLGLDLIRDPKGLPAQKGLVTGGEPGVRDIRLLLTAIAMPQAAFGDEVLRKDPFDMAVAYLVHILQKAGCRPSALLQRAGSGSYTSGPMAAMICEAACWMRSRDAASVAAVPW